MSGDPSFNTVSQFSHFFSTAFVVLLFRGHWWIILPVLALCAWKEFYYDERFESAEVRGSSAEDFGFYSLGVLAGWLCSLIH